MMNKLNESRLPEVTAYQAPTATRVGHVHLKVVDLERSLAFYRDVLGFTVTEYMPSEPNPRPVAFLAAGDYHHHVALIALPGTRPASDQSAGLYHVAFLYPSRLELARALKNILDHSYPIDHCHDYGIGEAVNLRDPDGIPLELYYDRPASEWPRADGELRMTNRKIEPEFLLQELHIP